MFLLLAIVACTPVELATETGTPLDCSFDPGDGTFVPVGRVACGEIVFDEHCSVCHGPLGRGTEFGPDLATRSPNLSDPDLGYLFATGMPPMPPQQLVAQETADVIALLRDWFGPYTGPSPTPPTTTTP